MSNIFVPYPHQTNAWNKMDTHFLNTSHDRGMVVVPTGGGKTTLASKWILDNLLNKHNKGYKILWLAHRVELLEQAKDTFLSFGIREHETAIVSSSHRSWSSISPSTSIVFSGEKSAFNNINHIENFIHSSEKGIFVVVDECHHSVASQYKFLLKSIYKAKEYKDVKILGLTATPTRMNPQETQVLWKLYDDAYSLDTLRPYNKNTKTNEYDSVIYEVSSNELISRNILAKPIPLTVKTEENFEIDFNDSDYSHLSQFGELGSSVLEKIGNCSSRNKLIVQNYKDNIGKYGKTIVFAINIAHCITLKEEFTKAGIKCDYVSADKHDNAYVINKFKNTDDIKVLISVIKLTEGFDCPNIQTVFLTRPTSSEVLFRQMIGRGLRGPIAGGTKECYLVTFVDSWDIFYPLSSEMFVEPEEFEELEPNTDKPVVNTSEFIDSEIIKKIYALIRDKFNANLVGSYESLPHGWYQWSEYDEDGEKEQLVMLFKSHFDEFENLRNDFKNSSGSSINSKSKLLSLRSEYFGDCSDPLPQLYDIYKVLNAINKGIEINTFTFEAKEAFNPMDLAVKYQNLLRYELYEELSEIFDSNELCQKTYKYIFSSFYDEVSRFIDKLFSKNRSKKNTIPLDYDLSKKTLGMFVDDGYNLHAIKEAILLNDDGSFNKNLFPEGLNGAFSNYSIEFTKRAVKTYFGVCRYEDKAIKINKILNSPDVPRFVIEFVLYHEMLHTVLPNNGHDRVFRERESKFTPSRGALIDAQKRGIEYTEYVRNFWQTKADQILDSLNYEFDLSSEYI